MLFDYRDVLHAGDELALRAAWAKIADLSLPMRFRSLRGTSAAGAWKQASPSYFCNAPIVSRSHYSPGEFAAEHSRLGRHFRRLASKRIELRQYFGDHSQLLRWIYERKSDQFAGSAVEIFHDPRRIDFMIELGRRARSICEIFTFETPTQVVAALVTFRDDTVRRFYTTSFDQEWAEFSPGVVLLYAITQRSLSEGLDCDYMTGEQPHKMRLATASVPLYGVDAPPNAIVLMANEQPATTEHQLPQIA